MLYINIQKRYAKGKQIYIHTFHRTFVHPFFGGLGEALHLNIRLDLEFHGRCAYNNSKKTITDNYFSCHFYVSQLN